MKRLILILFLVALVSLSQAQEFIIDSTPSWESRLMISAPDLVFADIDNNGFLDLICTDADSSVIFYNENGILRHRAPFIFTKHIQGGRVAAGDCNNDGFIDLAFSGSDYARVYLNEWGEFENNPDWQSDSLSGDIEWADIDGDGWLDLISSGDDRPVRIYYNHEGTLETSATWVSGNDPQVRNAKCGDVNNDGLIDLIINDGGLKIHINNSGQLDIVPVQEIIIEDDSIDDIRLGDIDGNDFLDVVAFSSGIMMIYNNFQGSFDSVPAFRDSCHYGSWYNIELGDLDLDGDLDMVMLDRMRLYIHDGENGVISTTPMQTITWDWQSYMYKRQGLAISDIDNDGDLDLTVFKSVGINTVCVFENNYANPWLQGSYLINKYPIPGPVFSLDWADIDNDNDADVAMGIAWPGSPTRSPNVLYENDNGHFDSTADWVSSYENNTNAVLFGDVDRDGDYDLVCGNGIRPDTGTVTKDNLYKNNNGVISSSPSWFSYDNYKTLSLAWGDVDGDGNLDLACGHEIELEIGWDQYVPAVSIYFNRGSRLSDYSGWNSGYTNGNHSDQVFHTSCLEFGDIDKDADLDLVCGSGNNILNPGPIRTYINNNGRLDTVALHTSDLPTKTMDISLADIDGDGYLDLLCATMGDRDRIYFNRDGRLEEWASWESPEITSSFAAGTGDIDNDGDLDVGIGNKIYLNRDGMIDTIPYLENIFNGYDLKWVDVDNDGDIDFTTVNPSYGVIVYENRLISPKRFLKLLPDNPPTIRDLSVDETYFESGQYTISFDIYDPESDLVELDIYYAENGGGFWQKASIIEDLVFLESHPSGYHHGLSWNVENDGVNNDDVWLRIELISSTKQSRSVRWRPLQAYHYFVGHINTSPNIFLAYPEYEADVSDSLIVIGKIWDIMGLRNYWIQLAPADDTSKWYTLKSSNEQSQQMTELLDVNISGFTAGDHILRVNATDYHSHRKIRDQKIRLVEKADNSPNIINYYPDNYQSNVPINAPVVIKFDSDLNQATIDNNSLRVYSDNNDIYSSSIYDYKSRTLTLLPDKLFKNNTFYYYVVDGRILSQDGIYMGGDFVSNFTTSLNLTTPDVDSIIPRRGSMNVKVETDQLLVFMDKLTSLRYVTVFSLSGDTIITQYISGDPTSVVIDLPQLAPKTYYLVRISNRADFDGEADYMSYFITEDTQMPLALEYTPEDEAWLVNLNEPVRIEFNKPLNTHTVDSGSFFVMGPSGKVPGFINFGSVGDSILLFNPSDPYIPGTRYTVVLTSHIQDNIGNRIDSLSWDFTTGYFKTVDYAGGTITAEGFEVVFPRGAFAAGREIGLGLIPSGRLAYPPEMTFTGLAVDMEGADPSRPGIITFYLPDSTLDLYGPIEWLKIYFYDSDLSSWTYLGGEGSRNELSVALDRLGRYGVFRVEAVDEEAGSYDFASSISLIPRVISPRRGGVNERLSVRFAVSEPTEVLAKIYNTDGRLIKTLIDGSVESVGQQLLEWDGKASDGDFAPDGLYIIVIEAQGKKIQKTFVILNK